MEDMGAGSVGGGWQMAEQERMNQAKIAYDPRRQTVKFQLERMLEETNRRAKEIQEALDKIQAVPGLEDALNAMRRLGI